MSRQCLFGDPSKSSRCPVYVPWCCVGAPLIPVVSEIDCEVDSEMGSEFDYTVSGLKVILIGSEGLDRSETECPLLGNRFRIWVVRAGRPEAA